MFRIQTLCWIRISSQVVITESGSNPNSDPAPVQDFLWQRKKFFFLKKMSYITFLNPCKAFKRTFKLQEKLRLRRKLFKHEHKNFFFSYFGNNFGVPVSGSGLPVGIQSVSGYVTLPCTVHPFWLPGAGTLCFAFLVLAYPPSPPPPPNSFPDFSACAPQFEWPRLFSAPSWFVLLPPPFGSPSRPALQTSFVPFWLVISLILIFWLAVCNKYPLI